jgi:arginase
VITRAWALLTASALAAAAPAARAAEPPLRVALVQQPFLPNGTSPGPAVMARGGIQELLKAMGASVRVAQVGLTTEEEGEYGGWKRLGFALGHLGRAVRQSERDGEFTVGLLATCPSMPGMVAGLQHSGPTREALKIGLVWLDAHGDFNTPETTRSGSLGGMPVAVATGRCLTRLRLDASLVEHLSVDDLRSLSPAVGRQLDRLSALTDKIYVHVDMDVLDPREVMGHGNKVPNGPSSEQLAALFEMVFRRYPKAAALGIASIPAQDEGGLSLAAVNRMIAGAVKGRLQRGAPAPPAP